MREPTANTAGSYDGLMLDLGLSLDVWPWLWLFIALVIVLIELTFLGGSMMLLPFGVSAGIAALLGFASVSLSIQAAVFVFGGAAMFLLFWRYQSLIQEGNRLPPGVGAMRLVGLTGIVTRTIDPADPKTFGQIRVEGEDWGAITDEPVVLPEGTRVRIVEVEGTHVRVEPTDPTQVPPLTHTPPTDPPPTDPPPPPPPASPPTDSAQGPA